MTSLPEKNGLYQTLSHRLYFSPLAVTSVQPLGSAWTMLPMAGPAPDVAAALALAAAAFALAAAAFALAAAASAFAVEVLDDGTTTVVLVV